MALSPPRPSYRSFDVEKNILEQDALGGLYDAFLSERVCSYSHPEIVVPPPQELGRWALFLLPHFGTPVSHFFAFPPSFFGFPSRSPAPEEYFAEK